jgi:hypothetical protein
MDLNTEEERLRGERLCAEYLEQLIDKFEESFDLNPEAT